MRISVQHVLISLTTTSIISAFAPRQTIPFYRNALSPSVVSPPKSRTTMVLKMSEDDEDEIPGLEEEPLSNGVDSVSWLPSVDGMKSEEITGVKEGAEILPLFPLGGIVYTPNSNHILNIFEPRYRQMYNDILMNGSKRFVVSMSHPTENGSFAQMGVLFQLEDLKEVSEQTNDQVKYICTHRVTGRVKLHRILNPEVWSTRDTYLKAEGTILDDSGTTSGSEQEPQEQTTIRPGGGDIYSQIADAATSAERAPKEEDALRDSFKDLVNLQHDLSEDVRFTRTSVSTLAVSPGAGEDSLWATVRLWQSYTEQRLVARQNELQKEFQRKLVKYLTKEKGVKEEELPSAIGFSDLSPALQKEVQELQKRMSVELQPLILESTLTMQKILEAEDHKERLNLIRFFVDAERKRLQAKKTLQGMFTGSSEDEEEEVEKVKKREEGDVGMKKKDDDSNSGSIIMDDDAFQ